MKAHSEETKSKEVVLLRRNSGFTEGSRYGYAVVNLGKLDSDEYEDFAVGSPFEANGVVYIYFGSRNFWNGKQGMPGNLCYHDVTYLFLQITPSVLKYIAYNLFLSSEI